LSGSCGTFGMRARPRAAFGICSTIESDAMTHRTSKALSCENPGARAPPGTAQGGATVITRLAQGQRQGEAGFKIGPTDEEAASAAVAASE
jgi:hypothetical protein